MKTHKEDATRRTSVFERRSLTIVLGLAVTVWVGAPGISLAEINPGVCCHQCSCLEAFQRPDGYFECNGIVKQGPFGGSCQGYGACYYSNNTCEWCDGYCCYGILFVLGEACEDPMACCDADTYGVCWVDPPPICADGGDYPADESNCSNDPCDIRTCCLPVPGPYGDFCDILYFSECIDEGGEPQPQGAPWCGDPNADPDNDDVINPCDNCPDDYNPNQEDQDDDGIGDVCDNCPEDPNPGQEDLGDDDGVGDVCDNCPTTDNGPLAGTCMGGPNDGQSCSDDAQCTPCDCNMDQDDCDTDGVGDVCEANCDGDCYPDDCDGDIDGDGVDNADDRCDFTPNEASIVNDVNSPFHGTLRSDLDGDCDVDADDAAILSGEETGAGCADGEDVEDPLCAACDSCCPYCPPCNSCCWQQW